MDRFANLKVEGLALPKKDESDFLEDLAYVHELGQMGYREDAGRILDEFSELLALIEKGKALIDRKRFNE